MNVQQPLSRTALRIDAQNGHEDVGKAIFAPRTKDQDLLNAAETINGWTLLCIVCINRHLPIVKLLEAGAGQRLCDLAGLTEKEHTVSRGYMKVAELLVRHGAGDHRAPASSVILRTEVIRSREILKCVLQSQATKASRLKPLEMASNCC